ncbi:unannotated protein [freshwater metagenome]|uniref:Unannotated protein n=1 Tax=freshwater metagenome TaxID=449393 RepID=A0A6J7R5Z4_9ZZZZ
MSPRYLQLNLADDFAGEFDIEVPSAAHKGGTGNSVIGFG